jgi:uncharacterized protein YndB with AHSA1/START domain
VEPRTAMEIGRFARLHEGALAGGARDSLSQARPEECPMLRSSPDRGPEKEDTMRSYDVQEIELAVPARRAFELLADPKRLPRWTDAFAAADHGSATLRTAAGEVVIGLETRARADTGTVDWRMTFPDGSVGWAHSRLVELSGDRCVYTFVLHAPPGPLEAVEGALEAQRATLTRELRRLKELVEHR